MYDAQSFLTSDDDKDIIGEGSYGVVRRCLHQELGYVAVKCMDFKGSPTSITNSVEE